jgi:Uma2 family endonuclease
MPMPAVAARPMSHTQPPRARWTVDQFHEACDRGLFEGRNVILVDGEILEMPPPNPPHNSGVELTRFMLQAVFGTAHWARTQMALDMGLDIDPVPDVAVVLGTPKTVVDQPSTSLLVVEVSDSTLAYDRGLKSNLYAQGGIEDYWVLDLNGRRLWIHRDPRADVTAPRGFAYASVQAYAETDSVAPLAIPAAAFPVSELLPNP